MLDHFKLLVLDGVNLNSTPAFDQHVRECLDITLADYGMLRFPPSYIAWAVLEKAFALTRAHGKSGLVRTVTPDHLVDGAGGGAPPSMRRSSASSASFTSEASWLTMTTPASCFGRARGAPPRGRLELGWQAWNTRGACKVE